MSLKQSAVSGIKWSFASQLGRQIMQLLTTIVLARFLSPNDFGLVSMATITTGFMTLFSDLGTSAAIIQRKQVSDSLVSTLFWVNGIFGILASFILIVCAPLVTYFYQEPRVTELLRVLALTFIISGFSIAHKAILEKKLDFKTLAKIENAAVFLGAILGIVSAFTGFGVWSLVIQTLTVAAITSILLWSTSQWKPQFIFCFSDLKEVSSFTLNLTGFTIFNYFVRNSDYILIGRFLSSQDLGYYTLAYRIMVYPIQGISAVVGRVMFPILSKIQDDNAKFRSIYLKAITRISLITFPLMTGVFVLSEPLILAFFGPQWRPVIILVMILSPLGLIQSVAMTVGYIYNIKDRTDLLFGWGIATGFPAIIAFGIGLHWGIIGVATAYNIYYLCLVTYPCFAIPFRLIELPMGDLGLVLWRPWVTSLIMLIVISALKFILPTSLGSIWILVILVPLGILSYLLASWWINRQELLGFINFITPYSKEQLID
ncbi:MOP flippase family protein [Nostoc sp.]|uniref:MOP flippase family protein n=1 Tax=Nostoc sp. TaxID=1180 RepID=UPI002FF49684